MRYEIRSDRPLPLTLLEQDETRRVLQNAALLLSTKKGTVPLYRDYGLPMEFTHRPAFAAEALAAAEIMEAMARFEPRAEVLSVRLLPGKTMFDSRVLSVELEVTV